MFSGALFDIVVAPRPQLCRKPRLKNLPCFPVLGGSSLSAGRKLRLVAAKPVSLAARFPRGLLSLLAAPLPKNLAPATFSGALFTSSSLRGLSFAEIRALFLFLSFFFFQVARPQLAASSASSPQSPFLPPLASLAACFPRLAAPLPKNLAPATFSGALFTSSSLRGLGFAENPCFIALSYSLLFPSNSPLIDRTRRRCRCPCCGGGSPKCPLFRASPKSGKLPFPSPSSRNAP